MNWNMFGTLVTNLYDAANNRTMIQDSFGGIVTRTFDSLNRMVTLSYTGQSTALREDYAYSARDQVTNQTRYGNLTGTTTVGYSTFSYDSVGRMTNLQHLNGSGSNIANFTNTYDLASRITSETLDGGSPTTYSYDITNQLTNDSAVTYSYDLNGNRTMSGYSTSTANQLASDGTWNYFYDQNGNLIQKVNIGTGEVFAFGYDNRNRMTTVTDTTSSGLQMQATYSYDALGQRISKDVWTGGVATVTQMAYDDGRQVWADLNGSSALQTQYMRTDNVLELPARVASGGTVAWVLTDRMGSVRNVVDSTGSVIATNTYSGFGVVESQSNVTAGGVYLWDGYRYESETGLFRPDSVTGRIYAPAIGIWTGMDFLGFLAGDTNLYAYVFNNPLRFTDSSGNAAEAKCGLEIGETLKALLQNVTSFLDADKDRAKSICLGRFEQNKGWDIYELAWEKAKFADAQRGCGIDPCQDTASVFGQCYHTHAINYILWGWLGKWCGTLPGLNESAVEVYRLARGAQGRIRNIKGLQDPLGISERLVWTRMGMQGIFVWKPIVSTTGPAGEAEAQMWNNRQKEAQLTQCAPCCGERYPGVLTANLRSTSGEIYTVKSGSIRPVSNRPGGY